jgi:UTP--glucose-1-phosphate uridylyltransferase
MRKITKAVIPAAGLGTRFLPVTKAVAKELLPIVDVPTLQLIVEEAAASGMEDVLIITRSGKEAIETYFSPAPDLEAHLQAKGKDALLARLESLKHLPRLHFIKQDQQLGLGHAISLAEDFAAGEPVAVLLGDDVVSAQIPATRQLCDVYQATGCSVVGVQPVAREAIHKYGIVAPKEEAVGAAVALQGMVEKPSADQAPSNLAILGRYVLTPGIFQALRHTAPGKGGEIQLTDALARLLQTEDVYACPFQGRRYDVGDQQGFIEANIEFALARPDMKAGMTAYLKELANHLD